MGTTRLFIRSVLTLGLVAIASSYGLAAERSSAAPGDATLKRASRVMTARVVSPQGENLGEVHDLVLTPDLNGISYVAVSRGGVLGIGNTLHAIPWSVLSPGLNGTLVAPITVAQFKQSRGFSPSSWPSSAESLWPASSMDRGETPAYSTRSAAYSGDVGHRRFSRIKGSDVKGADGKKIGDVRDLVIAMDTGRIAYTIVSYGGIVGLGERFAAVPQNAVTLEPALHVARVDASKTTLQANSFTSNHWPDLAGPSYSQELARAYRVEPSGTALGYVPPGAVAAAPRTSSKPAARSTAPSESSATPAEPSATMAEPAPNELTGTFNPATITTIDGTVLNVGKFKATATGQDMLWLRARTTDGRTVLVNLGPRSYISTQDFYVVRGDQIHLSGSEVVATASGRRVFLPTQVTYNNHVLRLRSETGTPLWEGQTTSPAATPPSERESMKPQSRADTSGTTALGYAPAEEPGAAERPMTSFAPAGLMALGAFDLSKSRTLDGTVTEVGKSQSVGGVEVVWLRVKTTDGQIVDVQVGPRDYVSKQGLFIVNGDRIHLTGWDARATGAPGAVPVFVVSDISQDGHTLQLRSSNGEPLWTSQAGIGEQRSRDTMGRPSTTETPSSQMATPGSAGTTRTRSGIAGEPNEPNKP
jgi:sporulation protein YlmC with PRC-barrel domain